jgi:hypothetical protein
VLSTLSLGINIIGLDGAKAFANALRVNVVLTKLNLDSFELNIPQLRGTELVETLDLSGKCLGVASGIVIAKLIEFNAVLTNLNLASNNLTNLGEDMSGTVMCGH